MPVVHRAEAFEDLGDGLVELPFAGIPCQHRVPDGFQPCVHCNSLNLQRPSSGATKQAFPWLHRAGADIHSGTGDRPRVTGTG
ncbi:hypothetical protein NicSoilB4_30140 [Arthrobacter sp. NicSoilB4]|nr:hypothetical protein NicSoilB4_30140 [Arthrobacter sp. NicSoilB4]